MVKARESLDKEISTEELLNKLEDRYPEKFETVIIAAVTAELAHEGKKRENGAPYLEGHVNPVTLKAVEMAEQAGLRSPKIAQAALLHDVIENPAALENRAGIQNLLSEFHPDVIKVIRALTKRDWQDFASKTENREKRLKEHLEALTALPERLRKWALVIKLADRLHNVDTLHYCGRGKQRRYQKETRQHFVPFFRKHLGNKYAEELEMALYQHGMRQLTRRMERRK